MALVSQSLFRTAVLSCILVVISLVSLLSLCGHKRYDSRRYTLSLKEVSSNKHNTNYQRLNLDEGECRKEFPLLFKEIDASVARGPFEFQKSKPDYKGLVQARIKNNAIYILSTASDTLPQILHQRTSILSQIHRALVTSPTPLPDTTFAFAINDVPKNNSWAFSRPNKKSSYNIWLMPLFSSWSWPKPNLGTMDSILQRITAIEHNLAWEKKIDKAIWRGTSWFNPLGHPNLRKDLVKVTRGKEWADVAVLDASTALPIEDFCKYKYVVYTEGVTYSGRLAYHQACESVLIMAPVTWTTVSAAMLRPVWGAALIENADIEGRGDRGGGQQMMRNVVEEGSLPVVESYRDANAVYVEPDFSDLEAVVLFLRARPDVATRIAQNQRKMMMIGNGYLSATAETCYWRALLAGWAATIHIDENDWSEFGEVRYETWLLNEVSRFRNGIKGKDHAEVN